MRDGGSAANRSLSRREKEVVDLLLLGKINKQIALALGVSERTVEFHLRNIYAKFHVTSRVELILKLGRIASGISENPVESTVEIDSEKIDNDNQPAQPSRAQILKNSSAAIKKAVAMIIRTIWEEIRNQIQNHPLRLSLLLFLTVSLTTRYTIIDLGLYFWFSYVLLGVILGLGGAYLGSLWKRVTIGETRFHPLIIVGMAALLPLLVAGLDELFLYTIVKSMGETAITIVDISSTAMWVASPNGEIYLHTQRNVMSDAVWLIGIAYMLLLFAIGFLSGKWRSKNVMANVL